MTQEGKVAEDLAHMPNRKPAASHILMSSWTVILCSLQFHYKVKKTFTGILE